METIVLNLETVTQLQESAVAFGFFDGLHLGHMQLIESVKRIACKKQCKMGIMTFSVHPKVVFGNQDFRYLMSLHQKKKILEELGFDYFFIIDFDASVAACIPEVFIEKYIVSNNIKHVVCGFDFNFGYRGQGNYQTLIDCQNGRYDVEVVEKYECENEKVSSSAIRKLLQEGNLEKANYLLSRPYRITGRVVHGKKNGRKMGFPTANVEIGHFVEMKKGVYAAYVYYQGHRYKAMANIGNNPTFGAMNQTSLEVNIFGFDADIYGEILEVDFIVRTRDEQKFASIDDLIAQLTSDRKHIDQILD